MKEPCEWTEADLLHIIQNGTDYQESLHLDYKACDALKKTDGKKNEVSKDVSSFANSDGGTIVYGIIEQNHVPASLDVGYDPNEISKEWLQQVVNSRISPKIDGVRINSVHLDTHSQGRYAYVVWIPQSTTAHQAHDKRYYKRYEFESVPMEDYEVRDVMFRKKYPILEGELLPGEQLTKDLITWQIFIRNSGMVAAQKFAIDLEIPEDLLYPRDSYTQKIMLPAGKLGTACKCQDVSNRYVTTTFSTRVSGLQIFLMPKIKNMFQNIQAISLPTFYFQKTGLMYP